MKKDFFVKIYNSRIFWMIISFLAAAALWVYVTSQQTDEYKRTFRGVQIELTGEDSLRSSRNLVITDLDVSTVTIDVTGPRRIVSSLDAADLKAEVDVSKLTLAAYTSQTYDIVFPDKVDSTNLVVEDKTPETVNFMVSALTSKTVQVRGSFDGSVADNRTAETPAFEPATITITGPDAYVRNISYAWVTFGAENIDTTYSVETGYTLMDDDGNACDITGLTMSDETVVATLRLLEVKEVPLAVNLTYGAGANEQNTIVTIEPTSVSLAGDSAVLAGINKIVVADIDATTFESTFVDTYPINIDDNLRNLSGATEAKVTISLDGLTTKKFIITNFSFINVTEGFTAEIVTNELEVVLRGTAEDLDAIQSSNLRAVADLTDYNESVGTFLPTVKIYADGFTNVGAIGTYNITINIGRE